MAFLSQKYKCFFLKLNSYLLESMIAPYILSFVGLVRIQANFAPKAEERSLKEKCNLLWEPFLVISTIYGGNIYRNANFLPI